MSYHNVSSGSLLPGGFFFHPTYWCAAAAAKSRQSSPTLCDPIDGSPPGSRPWDSPGKNTGVGCHFFLQCMKVKSESEVTQSCPTLRNPMDHSPPGSSIHGIFQARGLEWGATAFSNWCASKLYFPYFFFLILFYLNFIYIFIHLFLFILHWFFFPYFPSYCRVNELRFGSGNKEQEEPSCPLSPWMYFCCSLCSDRTVNEDHSYKQGGRRANKRVLCYKAKAGV